MSLWSQGDAACTRRTRGFLRLLMLAFALTCAGSARAEMEVVKVSETHTKYINDFTSAAEAMAACDAMLSPYNVGCGHAGSYAAEDPVLRWAMYEGGWAPTGGGKYILVAFYYCDKNTQIKVNGSHNCAYIVKEVVGDPKANGDNNDCRCNSPHVKPPAGPPKIGNPINPAMGNKIQLEADFAPHAGRGTLGLARFYNSTPRGVAGMPPNLFGALWTTAYDAKLVYEPLKMIPSCVRRQDNQALVCTTTASAIPGVAVSRSDNKVYRFAKAGAAWVADADVNDTVTAQYDTDGVTVIGWTYGVGQNGATEKFDQQGRLISIQARSGTTQYLTYSDGISNDTATGRIPANAPACRRVQAGAVLPVGKLLCVSDDAGDQIGFEYDSAGKNVVKSVDATGAEFTYVYDGASSGCIPGSNSSACAAHNLTRVIYPDAKGKDYWYNESAKINNGAACDRTQEVGNGFAHLPGHLTGIVDENGTRFASWTYSCGGMASSSQHAGGVDKVVLAPYSAAGSMVSNLVTHTSGPVGSPTTTASYLDYTVIKGTPKLVAVSNKCIECGNIASATYDANGNMASAKDWNGALTCYAYDGARNLETARIEGLPTATVCATALGSPTLTAPARRISTQWHSALRLPAAIAEPLKITTFTYDGSGNLLTKSEQATTDVSGVAAMGASISGQARTWTYTYNAAGKVLTARGPRRDVNDTVTNTFDSSGNLATVTNALAQVTTMSNYDANGRVGRITDANGLETNFAYGPRGWLASRSTTAGGVTRSTTYEYDGVGQLKKATMPDGSYTSYSYDDAHRLTGVADSVGNSIQYTLDLRGNRLSEQTRDPGGLLARQISRVFNHLDELKSVTGSIQ